MRLGLTAFAIGFAVTIAGCAKTECEKAADIQVRRPTTHSV